MRGAVAKVHLETYSGIALPPERFDGTLAELLRYAAAYGLLEMRETWRRLSVRGLTLRSGCAAGTSLGTWS